MHGALALTPYDRSIDTLISKLRGKLKAAGVESDYISFVRGQGYVIDHPNNPTKESSPPRRN